MPFFLAVWGGGGELETGQECAQCSFIGWIKIEVLGLEGKLNRNVPEKYHHGIGIFRTEGEI